MTLKESQNKTEEEGGTNDLAYEILFNHDPDPKPSGVTYGIALSHESLLKPRVLFGRQVKPNGQIQIGTHS